MPGIDPTSIPGSVNVPVWTLFAAIVVLFTVREVERKAWFAKVESATKAMSELADVVDKLADRLSGRQQ